MAAIGQIADVITQITEGQATIAAAVEDLTTGEMNRGVTGVASGSTEIADSISAINGIAEDYRRSAEQSRHADQLVQMSGELRSLLEQSDTNGGPVLGPPSGSVLRGEASAHQAVDQPCRLVHPATLLVSGSGAPVRRLAGSSLDRQQFRSLVHWQVDDPLPNGASPEHDRNRHRETSHEPRGRDERTGQ
ncbi:hypothetical protein [Cryptosporangium minutisporangium]|uniref:hypothetical protein n=1 Tax=Cryptosporangium minutisporangium TaxID=113569 RepID=UPI0031ECD657